MRRLSLFVAVLSLSPFAAQAQQGPPGWSLGAGLVVSESAYRGSDTRIIPIPALRYESQSLYLLGLEAGFHVASSQLWQTDVFLSGRLDGADDIELSGLAADGERDDGLDVGARLTYRSGALSVSAVVKRDALGVSDGSELGLELSRVFNIGQSLITPSLGVRWLDHRLANYYYGTLVAEQTAGLASYQPGSGAIIDASIIGLRPLQGTRWALFSQISIGELSSDLGDSPLVDSNTVGTFIAGATYQL